MFESSKIAVSAALAAQEKAVTSAFESSEKAILLTREGTEVRFRQHRDMLDQQMAAIGALQRGESRGEGNSLAKEVPASSLNGLLHC